MPPSLRLAAFAVAVSALVPVATNAMDDFVAASSSAPTAIKLCGEADGDKIKTAACKAAGYDRLVARIDKAFNTALAKAPANMKPLLKRDQNWFNEMLLEAADLVVEMDDADIRANFAETLRARVATLEGMADGFGRPGFGGRWGNTFGSVVVTPAGGGAYRLAVDIRVDYGSNRRRACRLSALAKPTSGGWLTGPILPDEAAAAKAPADDKTAAASESKKPTTIKMRRQGETLRLVLSGDDWNADEHPDCDNLWQITGSYFASGEGGAGAADKADTAFVAPTLDCTRPETATDEEICADPDLADNDRRLNRAWNALLPRLDETTRRVLMEDQRGWVKSQAVQYPEFLHPAWEKQTSQMHYTTDARGHVDGLQRERIALLEGFDEKRDGLAGVWLAYNAILKITMEKDGSLKGEGWKWDQGDWKAGCDYDMTGRIVGGVFRSTEPRRNPDTLERDHAMLIVNRLDDVFARKRYRKKDGTEDENADEAKCGRRLGISSTARLFPARPSPDIDNFRGSIR
jgi:uncharacterized protein YecT (DUF1311 family)